MRDSLKDRAYDLASRVLQTFKSTLMESPASRRLIQKSVPYLSVLSTFGICCVGDSSPPEDWLKHADEALYEPNKQGGDAARIAS